MVEIFLSRIEKKIHQIWLGPNPPPIYWLDSWKKKHVGWKYYLWRDKDVPALRNRMAYTLAPEFCRKADILRYEILYNHGGVYIDADTLCLKRLDNLLAIDEDIFAVEEIPGSGLIANGVIGCAKGNSFINRVIDSIRHDLSLAAWQATGPEYFTRMINSEQANIKIYPAYYFWPYHHSDPYPDPNDIRCKDSYGVHFWGSTHGRY